jgi:hypothetical protein
LLKPLDKQPARVYITGINSTTQGATKMSFFPKICSEKELELARVFRSIRPIRGQTEPLVAVEWYETLRKVAEVFHKMGTDGWYEFMGEAGYFSGN